jgi:hypothetical protein
MIMIVVDVEEEVDGLITGERVEGEVTARVPREYAHGEVMVKAVAGVEAIAGAGAGVGVGVIAGAGVCHVVAAQGEEAAVLHLLNVSGAVSLNLIRWNLNPNPQFQSRYHLTTQLPLLRLSTRVTICHSQTLH